MASSGPFSLSMNRGGGREGDALVPKPLAPFPFWLRQILQAAISLHESSDSSPLSVFIFQKCGDMTRLRLFLPPNSSSAAFSFVFVAVGLK
jgi:hypothetical protein